MVNKLNTYNDGEDMRHEEVQENTFHIIRMNNSGEILVLEVMYRWFLGVPAVKGWYHYDDGRKCFSNLIHDNSYTVLESYFEKIVPSREYFKKTFPEEFI